MLALIGNLDTTELLVVLVAAILIFGKRLPEVAAQAGAQLGKLRRTLDSAWKEAGVDREVREMQRSLETLRDAVPRDLSPATLARTAASEFQRRVEAVQEPATAPNASSDVSDAAVRHSDPPAVSTSALVALPTPPAASDGPSAPDAAGASGAPVQTGPLEPPEPPGPSGSPDPPGHPRGLPPGAPT
jgi:Sec-independent protein translocase protein TatA